MTIAEFFLKLAQDSELLERFHEDPNKVLAESGLTDEQRALLLTGNPSELRVNVTAELQVEGEVVAYGTVHVLSTVHLPPPPPPTKT